MRTRKPSIGNGGTEGCSTSIRLENDGQERFEDLRWAELEAAGLEEEGAGGAEEEEAAVAVAEAEAAEAASEATEVVAEVEAEVAEGWQGGEGCSLGLLRWGEGLGWDGSEGLGFRSSDGILGYCSRSSGGRWGYWRARLCCMRSVETWTARVCSAGSLRVSTFSGS